MSTLICPLNGCCQGRTTPGIRLKQDLNKKKVFFSKTWNHKEIVQMKQFYFLNPRSLEIYLRQESAGIQGCKCFEGMIWCHITQLWPHRPTGNGYIEGKELENFFRELETSRRGAGVVSYIARSSNPQIHCDQLRLYLFSQMYFSGSLKPTIQRKDEGVHAEVWQEQRWTDWDVRGRFMEELLPLLHVLASISHTSKRCYFFLIESVKTLILLG